MTKIWTNGANEYKTNVNEYNVFLEKFGTAIVCDDDLWVIKIIVEENECYNEESGS